VDLVYGDEGGSAAEEADRCVVIVAQDRAPAGCRQPAASSLAQLPGDRQSELRAVAARLLEVMPEDLVDLDELTGTPLEPERELLVEVRACRLGQRVVRGIPDQEMAEAKGVLPRQQRARRTDQLAPDERGEPRADVRLLGIERLHRSAMEDLALDRTALEHPSLGVCELVEAGLEERPEGGRDVGLALLRRHREHLGQEERVAAGRLRDSHAELGWQLLADQVVPVIRRERFQAEGLRPFITSRQQLGPARAEQEDRPARREQRGRLD